MIDAVKRAAEKGTSFGTPTELETQIAELICEMVPYIDQIRMVNSGTEACMSAIRLARGFTGREKIVKFAGCYHGHSDAFLIQAGSGAVTFGAPSSPGVTQGTAKDTLLAPFNDLGAVEALLQEHDGQVAAIIVEPVAGNMGCIPPQPGFLEGLKAACAAHGTLLIFDEVMTGFRLAAGGAAEVYGVAPDMVCFGKVIGGGLLWGRSQPVAKSWPTWPLKALCTKRARSRATPWPCRRDSPCCRNSTPRRKSMRASPNGVRPSPTASAK